MEERYATGDAADNGAHVQTAPLSLAALGGSCSLRSLKEGGAAAMIAQDKGKSRIANPNGCGLRYQVVPVRELPQSQAGYRNCHYSCRAIAP